MKKICVIGAGSSGLTAIKSCKEENMLVDCYEMSDNFGGLWRFHEEDLEDRPSVMKSTIINTSKEMSAFSDFPPPKEFANYMHNTAMLKYFELYAKHFDLLKHVKFACKVVKVEMADDYKTSGNWLVTVQELENGITFTKCYDGVMVCAGHHTFPYKPKFEGMEDFQGTVTHTHSLKSAKGFEDKTVLIIGIGNSAVDAAGEISRVSKQVYLSTRRGCWLYPRQSYGGMPGDLIFNRRLIHILLWWNLYLVELVFQFIFNIVLNHRIYGLEPKHGLTATHPTISDALPNCLLSGTVILKPDISRFTKEGVVFQGEDKVIEVDHVVMATGYQIKYPFLSEEIFKVKENSSDLYKLVFPAQLPYPSLAFIGLIQPLGCIFPIAEAQSRWFVQLMKDNCHLPSTEEMKKEVKHRHEQQAKRYVKSQRHTIQVNIIPYMDDICSEFGAKPNLWKMALKDPALFYSCLMEGCVPYQYRLEGPHAWKGARNAILTVQERVKAPFKTGAKIL